MSLGLIANSRAITLNLTIPFQGTGGLPPYVYSVLPGGVGGTIDSVTGLYTSPNAYGTDVIQVQDTLGDTFTLSIAILSYIELLCDILQQQLSLANGRVYLFDQKINQPKDFGMFIVVQSISCKPYSNTFTMDGSGSGLQGTQYTNFQATISIDIISRGIEALNRKEEVLMALASYYCESQQELNSFNISLLSNNFINLSGVDGAAIPYRFNISVNLQYAMAKAQDIAYYDEYQTPEIITDPDNTPQAFLLQEDGFFIEQEDKGLIKI